jgi:hypothetical protein
VRKMKCAEFSGPTVQDSLDQFGERRSEFSIEDGDIISVSVLPPTSATKRLTPPGTPQPQVEVVVVYWE